MGIHSNKDLERNENPTKTGRKKIEKAREKEKRKMSVSDPIGRVVARYKVPQTHSKYAKNVINLDFSKLAIFNTHKSSSIHKNCIMIYNKLYHDL